MGSKDRARLARTGALLLVSLVASACFTTPRPEDLPATQEFLSVDTYKEKECDRPLAVIPAGAQSGRPRRELANISVTCYPGALWLCERRLKERACALGADAVLLSDAEPGPHPAGGSRLSQVSRSGRAVRWTD
jgi:hypothetical protein